MHPPSQTNEPSALPESSWVLPESSSATEESAPLEDPPLEELPLEEPLLEEPPLEELPLEEPPLDIAPPESSPPPEAPSGAAPSLDSTGFEAPGAHAGTRGAVTSAKLQMRTDRAFMFGAKQSRCHVQVSWKCLPISGSPGEVRRATSHRRAHAASSRS